MWSRSSRAAMPRTSRARSSASMADCSPTFESSGTAPVMILRTSAASPFGRKGRMAIDVLGLAQQARVTKKLLYAQASAALRADLEAIHKRHDPARSAIFQAHPRLPSADWLKPEAT